MEHAWKWGLALSEWELAGERRELLQTFTHALVAADDRPRSDVEWSGVFIEMDAAEAYYVGSYLVRLDRELRRTVTQAKAGRIPIFETLSAMTEWRLRWISYEGEERDLPSSGRRPRPVVPTAGGLRLVAAEQGSCLLLLEALGMLQTLLTSQPITAVVNAIAMTGALSSVRARFGRKDALSGLTARQALDIIKEFGGDSERSVLGGPPDARLDLLPALIDAQVEPTTLAVTTASGAYIQGRRRIRVLQRFANGDEEEIIVE